jgi:hypothetical protein
MNARTFKSGIHPRTFKSGIHQHGSALSLLIALVVIGLLAWLALRGTGTATQGAGNQQQLVSCEKVLSDLIQRTGGIGPEYKAGYDAAPPACKHLLPAPAGIDPTARQAQAEQ